MAKRFAGRSVEMEDIVQIGSIGLLKAIDRFDISYDVKFSTYAVPMIIGEIRRYLRDDGMLKVSRNLKENCARIYSAREALEKELGREPILEEVAKATELSVDEVVMSMESGAEVESLHKIIYQGDGNDISLMDSALASERITSSHTVFRRLLSASSSVPPNGTFKRSASRFETFADPSP